MISSRRYWLLVAAVVLALCVHFSHSLTLSDRELDNTLVEMDDDANADDGGEAPVRVQEERALSTLESRIRINSKRKHRLMRKVRKLMKRMMRSRGRRRLRLARKYKRANAKYQRIRNKIRRDRQRARRLRMLLYRQARGRIHYLNSDNKHINCENPTLYKNRRGQWKPRRRTFGVRRFVRGASGIWYRSREKKYMWRNCRWVINPEWLQGLRNRADNRFSNRRAYANLLIRDDRRKAKLMREMHQIHDLRLRNKMLSHLNGSSRKAQRRTLRAIVRIKAKKYMSRFLDSFLVHYMNAKRNGASEGAAVLRDNTSVLGGRRNPRANTRFTDPARFRYDPQPGDSEFPYTSTEPGDDVSPPPPSTSTVAQSSLANVP